MKTKREKQLEIALLKEKIERLSGKKVVLKENSEDIINFSKEGEKKPDISDSYSVISKWTEPDGTEEWDVIHNGPLTYDDALKIAINTGKSWNKNVPTDRKNLLHREIPIKFEKLQKMIEKEELGK